MLKKIAVALVASGGLMTAALPAHAGGRVSFSLGVGIPLGVYAPAPAAAYYGPPAAYYAAPAYSYYAPPVAYAPSPGYYGYYGYGRRGYYPAAVYYRGGWRDHRGYRHR